MSLSSFRIYAHRGASFHFPENTMLAFKKALQLGANGLELDVQLSKDGHVVIIHDLNLQRTTNGHGLVCKRTLKELKSLTAGAWFHPRFQTCKIPTLHQLFKNIHSLPIYLNIELKNILLPMHGLEEKVIQLIRRYNMEKRVVLSTYNIKSLSKIKRLDASIPTALLYFGKLNAPWKLAEQLHADFLHPPIEKVNAHMIKKSRSRNIGICPYRVTETHQMQQAIEFGVDGVITDQPKKMKQLLLNTIN